ncbi:MAG TPA: alpha-L-fucosidase [Bacteroidales bacterium]|nr:alpha-L-fucosidase [Bacteroidales bacterium]
MNKSAILFVLLVISVGGLKAQAPLPLYPVPSAEQLAWHEMEMNAFIHFTINTFTDLEWGMGSEPESLFNPVQANPDQWVRALREAGFKGVILTCKHHDGFCLWPSKYTEHDIANSPFKNGKGDLVKEVSDACKKYGLKFGVYLSPWDRNQVTYGKPEYITYYRNQLTELFTQYGPVFEMWFDGANGGTGYYGGANERRTIDGKTYYDWPNTLQMIRKMEPGVIFFSDAGPGVRWVGNESGIAGETNWCTITSDTLYAGKPGIEKLLNEGSPHGKQWIPAETDVSIRPGWFWHEKENDKVKSAEELFNIYLTSVGRGSTLLLNVPPDRRGLIHEIDVESLRNFRLLLDSVFRNNLALNVPVKASSYRNNTDEFSPGKIADGNKDSYWTTNDNVTKGSIEMDLDGNKKISYIVLQEYIKLGQRVSEFSLEAFNGSEWMPLYTGTTIGYKRIIKIDPVPASKIRVNILKSKACPVISNVEVY